MGTISVLSTRPKPGRGRPKGSASTTARLRHVRAAYDHLVRERPLSKVARRFRVSPPTIHRWTTWAIEYDDPEAEALRRAVAARRDSA